MVTVIAHRGASAYTVTHPGKIERLIALGVDGLITDVPDRAAAARHPVALVA